MAASKPPLLRVHGPTSTTVSFTVSTRAPPDTIAAWTLQTLATIIRIAVSSAVLFVLWAKWFTSSTAESNGGLFDLINLQSLMLATPVGHQAQMVSSMVEWRILAPIGAALLWVATRRGYTGALPLMRPPIYIECSRYTEESLLVLRGLGVQTSSSSPSYLSTATTRFIPTTSIQDIFIHEAFVGFEVRFYLAIVVDGEQDVVVVFPVSTALQGLLNWY